MGFIGAVMFGKDGFDSRMTTSDVDTGLSAAWLNSSAVFSVVTTSELILGRDASCS